MPVFPDIVEFDYMDRIVEAGIICISLIYIYIYVS